MPLTLFRSHFLVNFCSGVGFYVHLYMQYKSITKLSSGMNHRSQSAMIGMCSNICQYFRCWCKLVSQRKLADTQVPEICCKAYCLEGSYYVAMTRLCLDNSIVLMLLCQQLYIIYIVRGITISLLAETLLITRGTRDQAILHETRQLL